MARENWHEQLEAYLDGELSSPQAKEFATHTASDPELKAELEERLAWRDTFRRALGATPPIVAVKTQRQRTTFWVAMAVAASLVLAVGIPVFLHSHRPGASSRFTLTMSGQVAAVRYGEIPGQTVVLQTGHLDLPAGFSH